MVQYVLELGHAEACSAVVRSLGGKFSELSMQKFSSNVVERCLKLGGLVSGVSCGDSSGALVRTV